MHNFRILLRPLVLFVHLLAISPSSGEQVIFSEIHYNAKAGLPDFIELTNNTATPLDTGKWFFSDGIIYTFPDFDAGNPNAHILKHFETILISPVDEATLRSAYPNIPQETRVFGPYSGSLSNAGETLTLSDKNGIILTTIEYNDGGKWPAAADGTGHTLIRTNPNRTNAGWRNWEASPLPGGTPGVTPAGQDGPPTFTTQIIETTSSLRYDQNTANADLGTAWRELNYDDSSWSQGPGLFGKETTGNPFSTAWTIGGRFTYYLRHEFDFNEPFLGATIDIESHIDDGAVFYLNGQEIARINMPEGQINFDTGAILNREWVELAEIVSGADISSSLIQGTNVLAVEVHNRTAGSNDIGFGANVSITAIEAPSNPLPNLAISEIHFGEDGNIDWVELHAPGNSPISVTGLSLSTSRSFINPVTLTGIIPAGGYLSFTATLPIDVNGDVDLFLIQGDTVIDAARLDRDFEEEGFQSFPVGQEWFGGVGDTRDAPNDPASRETNIVITEIMYDVPSDHVSPEFIEIYNRGNELIDLSGWEFTDGIRFEFPPGTTIAPSAYLVVAADTTHMRKAYGSIPVLGDWSGSLRDRGELIRLEDRFGNMVDEVDYLPEGDWPNLADGDGSSMELRHPDMDNNLASAWADSDETQKTTMQTFTYTADFVQAPWLPLTSGQELHAHLVGDAHVILENISVTLDNTGTNLLGNPATMSSTASSSLGWVCQGTHWQSFFDGGQLNLISTGHGDNKANRAEVDFATSPIVGNSYTLSFDARWVYGKSRIIFQTLDHGFGTSFLLPIPENLGTPGAPNSASISTPAPTVVDLTHSPAVPSVGQPVTVSAHVESATPGALVELVYRLDTSTGNGPWLRTTMTDDGTGLFKATVSNFTAQANITQFYVEATVEGASTTQPKFGAARPAMWIVDERTMPDQLLQHRFVISAYDQRALTTSIGGDAPFNYNFPNASNQYFNSTFIANESEIFYNAELRKSGSPFTRFTEGTIVNGKWKLPGDRVFRGRQRNVIDSSGTGEGRAPTPRFYDDRVGRYMLYQLGHPVNEMEFTHTVINAEAFRLRENHEPISNDFLRRNFQEGTKGTLLRVDDKWRFTDTGGRTNQSADWSYKDSENPIAYHSEWLMRTRESDHDYGSFIDFTRLLDENRLDPEILERMTNSNMLALLSAVRGYNGDWDSITLNRGKNAYFYRPKDGEGWMFLHWDGDRVFDSTSRPFIGSLTGVGKYFGTPFVRRQFNYYLTKLLDEHTKDSARTQAWLDAETAAVDGSGVIMTSAHYLNWFNSRESGARNYITSTVSSTSFAATTPNTPTTENLITLSGTAPPTILNLRIPGQPGASVNWLDRTTWEISGIVLREGSNELNIEGVDHEGNLVEQLPFTITKTNNAPPIIALATFPESSNIPLGQNLVVDALGSFDPEGTALNFQWSVLPETGVNFTAVGPTFSGVFSNPGFYLINSQVTDGDGNTSTRSIGINAYLDHRFSGFEDSQLDDVWTPIRTANQENASAEAHFSFEDREGRLTLSIPFGQRSIGLPEPILPPAENYIDFGSTWKYEDSGLELTGTFADPTLDDSSWSSGNGFLGFNPPIGLPAPGMQTGTLARGRVTYYFRHEFELNADPIGAQLFIDQIVDDGVRYFLNGQAIGSVRLDPPPGGAIDSTTTAISLPSADENVIEENIITVADASALLVTGTNVLAVEVHNSSAGNNDLLFGARVDIAANPIQDGPPDLNLAPFPWIQRQLPSGDWILETELKLENAQFSQHFAGLLVAAKQDGNEFRYGVGFQNGDQIAAFRVNPSGNPETLSGVAALNRDQITVRIERVGDLLKFEQMIDGAFTLIHQQAVPAGTTFSVGGIFASTESDQSLEVSFGYATLIDASNDFSSWMTTNGLTNPDAEYQNSGMSNLLAYALGRDLNPAVSPAIITADGLLGFRHRQRIVGGQMTYRVERSTDLLNWEPAGDLTQNGAPITNPDGTFTVDLLSDLSTTTEETIYYRLVVNLL